MSSVPGFAVLPDILSQGEVAALSEAITLQASERSRAGARHLLRLPVVESLARDSRLLEIAADALKERPRPFNATLFDKSPRANWLVVWHQDTALPLRTRRDVPGWGPWSVKAGVVYAHAPATALSRVVALRVHLDDSTAANGPLRVLPGSDALGVLQDHEIARLVATEQPVECLASRGSILMMRPLLVHSSSKATTPASRRVLHIEYTDTREPDGGLVIP
jgi:phytanoyl-CoA dioxygenase PhyH